MFSIKFYSDAENLNISAILKDMLSIINKL